MFKKDDFALLDGYKFYLVDESVDEDMSKTETSSLYIATTDEILEMSPTSSPRETKKILFADVFHKVNKDDKPLCVTEKLYIEILNGPIKIVENDEGLDFYFGEICGEEEYTEVAKNHSSFVAILDYEELFYADNSNLIILDEKEARHHPHILWVNFNNDKKEKLLLVHEKNNLIDSVKVVNNF